MQHDLPTGSKIDPYPWVGLNVGDFLEQFRFFLHSVSISNSNSNRNRAKKRAARYGNRPHSGLNIVFRYSDPSKGDRSQLLLMCSRCSSPKSHYMDRLPRYEISTGRYLSYVLRYCYHCSLEQYTLFVPVNTSQLVKRFRSAIRIGIVAQAQLHANEIELASHVDFEQMKIPQLQAWIRSQGFYCAGVPRGVILERAESIRKWLCNDQVHKKPEKHHTIAVPIIRNRHDPDRLLVLQLRSWIRSQDHELSDLAVGDLTKIALILRAKNIWDTPGCKAPNTQSMAKIPVKDQKFERDSNR